MEAGVAVSSGCFLGGTAAAPSSWDLWHCLLFRQVNAPSAERKVLISNNYLFALAEGKKVIYIHSCLQQIIEHQEGNRLAIKRIKCVCSYLIIWMQSLKVTQCHGTDGIVPPFPAAHSLMLQVLHCPA